MNLLEPSEREVMKLRFVEQLQYHEIAAAQAIPIGTVQSRVFNAKKNLAPHLAMIQTASLASGMNPEGAPAQSSSGWPAS
jgi:DNA-directed RNA polymerase specialized sigma24 family protein